MALHRGTKSRIVYERNDTMFEVTESKQNYLEIVYLLSKKGSVRAVDIAEMSGYSKPSVSNAIHALREDGYLTIDDMYQIKLTEKGEEIAIAVYERPLYRNSRKIFRPTLTLMLFRKMLFLFREKTWDPFIIINCPKETHIKLSEQGSLCQHVIIKGFLCFVGVFYTLLFPIENTINLSELRWN